MTFFYIPTKFQWRKDTAANWASNNPTPLDGEPCMETDTAWPIGGGRKFKIGDGVTAWSSLDYAVCDVPFTDDAPSDGTGYVRKDGAWASESGGGADLTTTARFYDECYGNAVTQTGWVAVTTSGTISVQQSVAGMNGGYKFDSGASTGNSAGVIHGGFYCEPGGGVIRATARLRPQHAPSGSQQSWYQFGLKAGSGTTDAGDYIRVRADDASGGWLLQWACAAGTTTTGASVIPGTITGGTTQELELVVAADGLSVAFSIDGTLVDTLTLPAGFTAIKPFLLSRKSGASGTTSALWVDKVLVEQDR